MTTYSNIHKCDGNTCRIGLGFATTVSLLQKQRKKMKVHHSCGLILRPPNRQPWLSTKQDGFHKEIFNIQWKQAHHEEALRCLVKFSFCWSGALAASLWWSCGRAPLPLQTQHLEDPLVCSLLDLYKGSRCDTQRPSPYLWPCSSLLCSESCWNETWHFVLQTGHWSDSSRCGNGGSGHLRSKKMKSSLYLGLYNGLDFCEPDCF